MEVLSNAEQHFLGYKSIAAIENGFKKMILKGTAILDVGGGNLHMNSGSSENLFNDNQRILHLTENTCGTGAAVY